MDRSKVATLLLCITGIIFACASFGLLIASQIKQNWIRYIFVSTFPITFTTTADIGLWTTYYVIAGSLPSTVDSATTGYFPEAAVKACRALAILTTILTFATMIIAPVFLMSTLKMLFSLKIKKIIGVVLVVVSGSAGSLASITLIVARTMFKSGMELDISFNMGIAATILLVVETVVFIILINIAFRIGSPNVADQTERKIKPIQTQGKKSDVTSVADT